MSDLQSAARDETARRRLAHFAQLMDPNYVVAPHIEYLCDMLESLERDEIENLIVVVPPRHGKTRLLSQIFPAWWLGRRPSDELIFATNTSGLAEDNSFVVRSFVSNERFPFATRVSEEAAAKELWRTTQGGVIRAAGVGSAIQGRGISGVGIIDDPIAGAKEATEAAFEAQWRWFMRDFFPRRLNGGHIIVSMFRWGDGDLIGRILDHEDEDFRKTWSVVELPAYAKERDPMGRVEGAVLWEPTVTPNGRKVGFGKDFLETQRKADPRVWAAQYECSPIPDGGLVFHEEWFKHRWSQRIDRYGSYLVMAIDGAWTAKKQNDPSAIALWGTDGRYYYLLECACVRVEFPELVGIVNDLYRSWKPHKIVAEAAASGIPLVQQLAHSALVQIQGIPPRGDKISRVQAITPLFEAERVLLPEHAPWLSDWITEHLRFPAGRHDDRVDTTSLALAWLQDQNLQADYARRRSYAPQYADMQR